MIEYENLVRGTYYLGHSRNAEIAMWTGKYFLYVHWQFGESYVNRLVHPRSPNPSDFFTPTHEVPERLISARYRVRPNSVVIDDLTVRQHQELGKHE